MRRVLVDSSAWIETLRRDGDPAIREKVMALTADDRAILCDFVRVELWNGARNDKDRAMLREIEASLETVPTTPEVWKRARDFAELSRKKGLTIPASDLVIAACARVHDLDVLHRDAHFDRLAEIVR